MSDLSMKVAEQVRMDSLDIPYRYVHMTEHTPVVIVTPETLADVVRRSIDGRFVAQDDDGVWSCAVNGVFKGGLTEYYAYSEVLGYSYGRAKSEGRYKGYYPLHPRLS